jgi:hypothetical protein
MHALTATVHRIRIPAHPDPPIVTLELFQKPTETGNTAAVISKFVRNSGKAPSCEPPKYSQFQ